MTKKKSQANRGMDLEKLVEKTNEYYKSIGVADVRKVPTPTKILRHTGGTFVGHTVKGEWVDFVGIDLKGTIAFDAKECTQTRFPMKNIHEHQVELLQSWNDYGANTFILLHMKLANRYFVMPVYTLGRFYDRMLTGEGKKGTASISLEEIEENCMEVYKVGKYLDYLRKLD